MKKDQEKQQFKMLIKSIYKAILKKYRADNRYKDETKEIVEDILDPNTVAQVNPNKLPPRKDGVLNKNINGIDKLRTFIEKKEK